MVMNALETDEVTISTQNARRRSTMSIMTDNNLHHSLRSTIASYPPHLSFISPHVLISHWVVKNYFLIGEPIWFSSILPTIVLWAPPRIWQILPRPRRRGALYSANERTSPVAYWCSCHIGVLARLDDPSYSTVPFIQWGSVDWAVPDTKIVDMQSLFQCWRYRWALHSGIIQTLYSVYYRHRHCKVM